MRTRRSPRNQARLWHALGEGPAPRRGRRTPLLSRAEARRRLFAAAVPPPVVEGQEPDTPPGSQPAEARGDD